MSGFHALRDRRRRSVLLFCFPQLLSPSSEHLYILDVQVLSRRLKSARWILAQNRIRRLAHVLSLQVGSNSTLLNCTCCLLFQIDPKLAVPKRPQPKVRTEPLFTKFIPVRSSDHFFFVTQVCDWFPLQAGKPSCNEWLPCTAVACQACWPIFLGSLSC